MRLSNASAAVAANFEATHVRERVSQVRAHAALAAHLHATSPLFGIYAITITEGRLVTCCSLGVTVMFGVWRCLLAE